MFVSPARNYNFNSFESASPPQVHIDPAVGKTARKLGWEGSLYPSRSALIKALPAVFFGIGMLFSFRGTGDGAMFIAMLAVFMTLGIQGFLSAKKAEREISRYVSFAEENNLEFEVLRESSEYPQIPVLNQGFGKAFYTMFTSKTEPQIAFGNYRFKERVSNGKSSRTVTYRRGIAVMKLPKSVPHIAIVRKGDNTLFHKNERLKLGIGVDDKLEVYAPASLHANVLTILTPDVLAALVDSDFKGRIHLVKDEIVFIYDEPVVLRDRNVWTENLARLQETVWVQIRDQVNRYNAIKASSHLSAETPESELSDDPETHSIKRAWFDKGTKTAAFFAGAFGASIILIVLLTSFFF